VPLKKQNTAISPSGVFFESPDRQTASDLDSRLARALREMVSDRRLSTPNRTGGAACSARTKRSCSVRRSRRELPERREDPSRSASPSSPRRIHPGLRFLAGNAPFAKAVEKAKITWIGPSAEGR